MNLAIFGICDFEEWNNPDSLTIGGSSGVIKSILPHLKAEKIYLLGITSKKASLKKELPIFKNVIIYPIVYVPKDSKVPERIRTVWYSRKINKALKKYHIHSIYSHAEEILFWVKPGYNILYHMHGANNALSNAKIKMFRNAFFLSLWAHIRKNNINKARKIIVIDYLCREVIKKYNKTEKAILIPNFVDTSIFYYDKVKSELLKNINEKIILFVGRIEEVKGLELFVDILNKLDKIEKGKWKGVIVGKGSYKKNIENYIKKESREELFFFAGAVFDQHVLRKIYSQSSVLIISSFFEGIPMVVLEALACGTPVVSTNVGGIKQLIADEQKCYVIDERLPSLFVDKILEVQHKKKELNNEFKFSVKESAATINALLNIE
jgi:glycosyltransferase involved in cell wall biosynthesis